MKIRPEVDSVVLTRRAAPSWPCLSSQPWQPLAASDGGCGSAGVMRHQLLRRRLGLRLQSQVVEDLLDHRLVQAGRDDLELPAATVRSVLHVDVEDGLELVGPVHSLTCLEPAVRQQLLLAGCVRSRTAAS